MSGDFSPRPEAAAYANFFAYMVDEANSAEDPPFDDDLLDPENWYVDEEGKKRGIEIPAIYNDGLIAWRWR